MPVYNAEKYLKSAIDSILNQTYKNFELIIINDGSTDNSRAIVSSYRNERIKIIDNEKNRGLIFSLNKGIDSVSGKYIARMDADDISLPTRLEKQVWFLEQNTDVALLCSSGFFLDENGEEKGIYNFPVTSQLLYSYLFFANPIIHSSVIVKTEVLRKFKYNKDYYLAEDYFLWSQISREFKVANISEPLVKYRVHEDCISIQKKEEQEECVKRILAFNLSNLGLNEISPYAKEMHYNLLYYQNNSGTISLEELWQIHKWIKRLINQNKKMKVYDIRFFISELETRWSSLFNLNVSSRHGIKVIPLIFLSLSRKSAINTKIRFAFRCFKQEIAAWVTR
jgi:glycosyltransferase involved in cell wall biosynthesis